MLRVYALVIGFAFSAAAIAQDRNTIQSCLAYEMAAILQSAPEGLTGEQAFAVGRELSNKIPDSLLAAIKRLPDLQETGRAMVQAAHQSAISLSRQLTPKQLRREVERCRTIFPLQTEKRAEKERSFPPLRSYAEIASSVNKTLLKDGMLGVLVLLESCHGQNSIDGRDCVALEAAGKLVFDAGVSDFGRDKIAAPVLEYFDESAITRRMTALEREQRGTREALTRYYEDSKKALPKLLLEDLRAQTRSSQKSNCLVHDSDIADSYEGSCRDGLANGNGTARGRDEYSGEFLNGDAHGRGVYRWGDSSKWRSEIYEGWHYRGKRYGFGAWSIDVNSNHPALQSASKFATLIGTRYFQIGLWARKTLIKSCQDLAECLDSHPVFRTTLASTARLLAATPSGALVSDIRAALFSDLELVARAHKGLEACFAGELFPLARVDDSDSRQLDREKVESLAILINDRALFAQLVIYCADVGSKTAPNFWAVPASIWDVERLLSAAR